MTIKKIAPVLGLIIFAFAAYFIHRIAGRYTLEQITTAVGSLPPKRILYAFLATLASYTVLGCYDVLGVHFLGRPLPIYKSVFAAGVAFAFTNTIGLANIGGTSVRLRLYSHFGFAAKDIVALIIFISFSFWTGFLGLSGFLFLFFAPEMPPQVSISPVLIKVLGGLLLLVPLIYLMVCLFHLKPRWMERFKVPLPSWQVALLQIVISAAEWSLAGAALYVLLPHVDSVRFIDFLAVFATAQVLAFVTHVPGGLGVIEAVVIYFLTPDQNPTAEDLGALLAFRCIYYFLPLLLGVIALVLFEVFRKSRPETPRLPN